jgi:carbonic anhydrase
MDMAAVQDHRLKASGSTTRHPSAAPALSPDLALERLMEGNGRFVAGKLQHNQISQERLASLASGQAPFAAILGCADSRVPPELVFDQGFGDLFVLRLAGNVYVPSVAGSLQYAHRHLGVALLVVLGHEGCGAVGAALACKFHQVEHPAYIQGLVQLIEPALKEIDPKRPAKDQLAAAVEANVRWTVEQMVRTPEVQRALAEKRDIRIVGAVYELATGKVRWLK